MTVDAAQVAAAAEALRAGRLVAFPTETVYGLGADASSPAAVARLYAAKGRPGTHPVIVHLAHVDAAGGWVREFTDEARTLARAYWPGPLTLVMRRAPHVLDAVTGGQDTVALRVPSHPVAHELLSAFGGGIAAPSANRFGRISATTAQHVRDEFGAEVEIVLDGGASDVGIESTIVDVSAGHAVLLRPGAISALQIEQTLGAAPGAPHASSPRASGALATHYAPSTPLLLLEGDLLLELAATLAQQGKRIAALARTAQRPLLRDLRWIAAPGDPHAYAHDLYANLRTLDAARCDVILVQQPPQEAAWAAINDRLSRAAAGTRLP